MPYHNKQEAVDILAPGYTITGEAPNMVEVANPQAGLAGQPAKISQQQGWILSINNKTDPSKPPDTIVIKEVGNAPWKGGVGYDVVQGPQHAQPRTPTPTGQLDKLDANGDLIQPGSTTKAAFVRDPSSGQVFQVDATVPTDPSTWTPLYDPNDTSQVNRRVIGLWDAKNNKMAATVPQTSQSQNRTGTYTNLTDPNNPKRVIGLIDDGSKEIFNVSRDPASQKQIVQTPNKLYVFNDDGSVANSLDIDRNSPLQAVQLADGWYQFNPNETDPTKALKKMSGNAPASQIVQNGVTYQQETLPDGSITYKPAPGIPTPREMTGVGTESEWLITYDKTTGEEISRQKNPNYRPQQATAPQPNANVRKILVADPDKPGQLKTIDNPSFMQASEALRNLAQQLSGQVVNGDIGIDEAKTLIDAANQQYQTGTTAAGQALQFVSEGARTGGQLLQQRAATAQGLVGSALNLAGQGQHYGGGGGTAGLSGGMMQAPAGFGQDVTQGAQAYATELLGGQNTLNAAAAMVRAASPDSYSPLAQAGAGYLTQMLDRFKQANGGVPHPIEQAHTAAVQQQQNGGGVVAPDATPQFPTFDAQYDPRFTPEQPQQPPGTVLKPGVAGTVAPGDPRFLGTMPQMSFQAPQAPIARAPEPYERSINFNPFTAPRATPTIVINAA